MPNQEKKSPNHKSGFENSLIHNKKIATLPQKIVADFFTPEMGSSEPMTRSLFLADSAALCVRNLGFSELAYSIFGMGLLGWSGSLLSLATVAGVSTVASGGMVFYNWRRNPPLKTPASKPAKLNSPAMDQSILDAQANIAKLDHRKFEHDLPNSSSGWSVDDQRAHNDLYWQGAEAFWLNPKVYQDGKLDLLAENCPAPDWWSAPQHLDVIPDQVNLVDKSLQNPHPISDEERFGKMMEEMNEDEDSQYIDPIVLRYDQTGDLSNKSKRADSKRIKRVAEITKLLNDSLEDLSLVQTSGTKTSMKDRSKAKYKKVRYEYSTNHDDYTDGFLE